MTRRATAFRTLTLGLAGVALVGLSGCTASSTSAPQDAGVESAAAATAGFIPATAENLPGTWQSTVRHYLTPDGTQGEGTETLVIDSVADDLFQATREVTIDQAADFGTGDRTETATLSGIGVINPDGSFSIVKKGDDGRFDGWLVDEDTIEAVYREAGDEPWVVRQTLVRESGSASPRPSSSPTGGAESASPSTTVTSSASPTTSESQSDALPTETSLPRDPFTSEEPSVIP